MRQMIGADLDFNVPEEIKQKNTKLTLPTDVLV
jgi:hypothetical protein